MDIESYPEFKENILFDKNEESQDFNRYIVTSVEEFYKLVLKHKELIKNIDEEQEEIIQIKNTYYRGQANKDWEIVCSLFRNSLIEKEEQLIQEVLNRRPLDFINCKNNLEKLVLMQHYGIPTRLLDITINPLVALYFSCEGGENEDGAVYIFEENYDTDLNFQEIIASFSFLKNNGTLEDFRKILEKDKDIFEESIIDTILNKNYILINPKLNNDRIVAQQGLFLCCSNKSIEGKIESNNPIKKKAFPVEAARKIIVSKEYKKSILKELEFLGIKKSILFPELENHANELIEKFTVKQAPKKEKSEKEKLGTLSYRELINVNESSHLEEAERRETLISGIKFSSLDSELINDILSYIEDKDFFLFDSKKAIVKNMIRRANNLDDETKNKLIALIGEDDNAS
ncbi:FRG domain-containing protein [Fusobacterium varium]|uniref:FRG domain-containing protein n=1 Tax=Fusobacterium varium TaxID=856 RepID=UPI0032C15393